ncbi:four helix bundle protein [Candidatus Microgenomates bacterium]|nr:four helix bundle protein [Candidatus Microgenomates bacterium]
MTNWPNEPNSKKPGGYKNLLVYQQAVIIYDLNIIFINRYIPKTSRTCNQMEQAGRSGKQNIVEGSLEKSSKLNINLTSVSRASFGELLEDYKDFLRTKGLKVWDKNDPRVLEIRATRVSNLSNSSNWTNLL